MTKAVMIDLETWSTKENALIISLGAVLYETHGSGIIDHFHVGIVPDKIGTLFDIDADTILWWMHPDRDEARAEWLKLQKIDIASALEGFAIWCAERGPIGEVWGNGATFDNVVLRKSYDLLHLQTPWEFWKDRCYRTVKSLAPRVKIADTQTPEGLGMAHSALYDAWRQALHHQTINRQIRLGLLSHVGSEEETAGG